MEFPGLKRPNSKIPALEVKVLPSMMDCEGVMESSAGETKRGRKNSIEAMNVIVLKESMSIAALHQLPGCRKSAVYIPKMAPKIAVRFSSH